MTDNLLPKYTEEFSEEEVEYISSYMEKMRSSPVTSAALICKGKKCEILAHCPLHQLGKNLPVGKPCPVEDQLINQWTQDLIDELGVEHDAWVDQAQVSELVRARLLTKRASEVLANEEMVVDSYRGQDESGTPIYDRITHPLLALFKDTNKISADLHKSLIASREAKSQDKSRKIMSYTDLISAVQRKLSESKSSEQGVDVLVEEARGNLEVEARKKDFKRLNLQEEDE